MYEGERWVRLPDGRNPSRFPVKRCEMCNQKLRRIRYAKGNLEGLVAFKRRKTCSKFCYKQWLSANPTKPKQVVPPKLCPVCNRWYDKPDYMLPGPFADRKTCGAALCVEAMISSTKRGNSRTIRD